MRLNVEVKKKLYDEFWHYAALDGWNSISEAIRALMVAYVRKRKREEGIIPLHDEVKDDRAS